MKVLQWYQTSQPSSNLFTSNFLPSQLTVLKQFCQESYPIVNIYWVMVMEELFKKKRIH